MRKIVIDTNVLISGIFWGGYPKMVIDAVLYNKITACATADIVDEYEEIFDRIVTYKHGMFDKKEVLMPIINAMNIIAPITNIHVCRDDDDDKFIGCAIDSKALYIVSGDNDLLDIREYENIQIITARDFCENYLMKMNIE